MFSMPTGIDYGVNEAALLAVARDAFAEHDQIWMAASTKADRQAAVNTG